MYSFLEKRYICTFSVAKICSSYVHLLLFRTRFFVLAKFGTFSYLRIVCVMVVA